jgi:hypothetical protein
MATIPLYDKRMSPSGATARVEARPVLGSMDAAAAPYRALSQVGEAVSGIGQQMGQEGIRRKKLLEQYKQERERVEGELVKKDLTAQLDIATSALSASYQTHVGRADILGSQDDPYLKKFDEQTNRIMSDERLQKFGDIADLLKIETQKRRGLGRIDGEKQGNLQMKKEGAAIVKTEADNFAKLGDYSGGMASIQGAVGTFFTEEEGRVAEREFKNRLIYENVQREYNIDPEQTLKKLAAGEMDRASFPVMDEDGNISEVQVAADWDNEYLQKLTGSLQQQYNTRSTANETDLMSRYYDAVHNPQSGQRLDEIDRQVEVLKSAGHIKPEAYNRLKKSLATPYKDKENLSAEELTELLGKVWEYYPNDDPTRDKQGELWALINQIPNTADRSLLTDAMKNAEKGVPKGLIASQIHRETNQAAGTDLMQGYLATPASRLAARQIEMEAYRLIRQNPGEAEKVQKWHAESMHAIQQSASIDAIRQKYQFTPAPRPTSKTPSNDPMGLF